MTPSVILFSAVCAAVCVIFLSFVFMGVAFLCNFHDCITVQKDFQE